MLWVDKHRPNNFRQFVIHKFIANSVEKLVSVGDCPHILFYGPPGSGKKTIILSLLQELYGCQIEKTRVEHKPWDIDMPGRSGKIEVDVTTLSSNFHVEINPSDAGYHDKYIIQGVLEEMAKNNAVLEGSSCHKTCNLKLLIINEADQLTNEAQQCLRRNMEKYCSVFRLVMCCTNLSTILRQVRSRCLCIRVPAPTHTELSVILQSICLKENIDLPASLSSKIAISSNRNIRKSILMLEACKFLQYPFRTNTKVPIPDWEMSIYGIAKDIVQEQTREQLYRIRLHLYELLLKSIPPNLLIGKLSQIIFTMSDENTKHKIASAAAIFDHRIRTTSKPILHIEAFVARIMYYQKHFQRSTAQNRIINRNGTTFSRSNKL